MTTEACTDLSSDHTPVILNMSSSVVLVQPAEKLHNKSTNWEMYKDKITMEIKLTNPLKTVEDIEEAIESFNKIIFEAVTIATKVRKNLPLTLNKYPKTIKDKISKRRILRKIWHESRYPADETAFNRSSNELKDLIKSFTNNNL
ncbi:unnamed protein product [Pieris macdunnoughi]|uniref:Uncharacterized protein n=1 Tax=Pieris macdunnoughi TaxID=345717 RepID=A0A821XZN6_9NEOP|nr:unnamed protein product [Pieris macdunnoughi]